MSLPEPLVHAFEAPCPRTSDPDTLLAAAEAALSERGLAEETRRIYLTWMRRLLTSSRRGPTEDMAAALSRELGRLAIAGHGVSSLKQARAAARFLLRIVLERPSDAPLLRIATRPTVPPLAAPTRDEVRRLLAACPGERDRLLIGLVCGSGLRLGEALRLCAANIDVTARRVRVPSFGGRPGREASLPPLLAETAGTHLRGSMPWDWVFSGKHGRRLSMRGAQRAIERAAARCGLEKRIHSRSLRRGFGRVLADGDGIGLPGGIGSPL